MNLPIVFLTVSAEAAPVNKFDGSFPRTQPIEDLFWGLIGLGLAVIIVSAVMRVRRQLPGFDPVDGVSAPPLDPENVLALKLAQWRSSALILTTVTALSVSVSWFNSMAWLHLTGGGLSFADELAIPLAMALQSYLMAFVPVLVWHLADLIERPRAKPRFLASHALLTGVLATSGLGFVLAATGWLTVQRPCGGTFTLLFQACMGLAPALSLPIKMLILALPLISLVKLAVALWSRLEPRS